MEIPQVSGQIQRHQDFGFTVPHRPVSSNNPSALKRADRDLGQRSKSFVQTSQVYECLLATLVDVVDGGLAQRQVDWTGLWGVQNVPALILPPGES